jgi:curved DNA-binding protein CbpA
VLQIDPDLPFEEVKKKFRRLSILVHPDKNQVISNGNELLSLAVAIMEVLIFSG